MGGRIRKSDVLAAAEKAGRAGTAAAAALPGSAPGAAAAVRTERRPRSPQPAAQRGTVEKMSRMRQVIATRMVESLQVSAQLTTVVEVDVTKIARLRGQAKARASRRAKA